MRVHVVLTIGLTALLIAGCSRGGAGGGAAGGDTGPLCDDDHVEQQHDDHLDHDDRTGVSSSGHPGGG